LVERVVVVDVCDVLDMLEYLFSFALFCCVDVSVLSCEYAGAVVEGGVGNDNKKRGKTTTWKATHLPFLGRAAAAVGALSRPPSAAIWVVPSV
jgi:hypothetical protein